MKVELQNLTKIFPSRNKKSGEEVVAVNDFTFTIPDGKLIGLLGPSGCGKSTTLYMISGLQKPTSGKIFFGEDDVTEVSTENRGVGLVFQNYALYPVPPAESEGCGQAVQGRDAGACHHRRQAGADRRADGA